ncbi:OmpA family protein [Rhodocytophaga rosea]|uniref:OmpA family protein n=1 Tax=Rhodocytophaga rosea TaxID=2704465 RepID=A0A6C0GCM8_9BACT|nr:OmpA family protein [Rhodocytophaga rosea]QHT65739.1 OmpA family protein [Rhodocytophaga rosea]
MYAQVDKDLVAEADAAYNIGAKSLALDNYQLALKANPDNVRANFMAGKSILETIDKSRASKYLIRAYELDPNISPDILLLIGQSFQFGKDFDNAITYYEKHKQRIEADAALNKKAKKTTIKVALAEIDVKIAQCNNGKKYTNDPLEYAIKNLGDGVNTGFADYAPAVNKDENLMIFTSRREGSTGIGNVDKDLQFFEDIYISEFKDGAWQAAKNIGTNINTEYHDASIGLSGDGKELFLYKDENGGDIYVSRQKNDGTWSDPEPISSNVNSTHNENSVSISPDGQTLFFTSDRPGGKGGIDIYISKLDKRGQWSKPSNIGAPINTAADEDGPFIDYDGKTLYFSSRGHEGMGGYDIFVSEFDSTTKKWSEPVNIGYPINTPDEDIYFVKSGDRKFGYYASVKDGGLGEKDIYKVAIPDNLQNYDKLKVRKIEGKPIAKLDTPAEIKPVTLTIQILDELNSSPMDAIVAVKSSGDNIEASISKVGEGIYTCTFNNITEKEYTIAVEKNGYMFKNVGVTIPAVSAQVSEINKNVILSKLQIGFKSILRNIYFDSGKASLKSESYEELNKLERMLRENPQYHIEISGHTDKIGDPAYNKKLSQQRANKVIKFLIDKGIESNRLTAVGYGEKKPLATNDDELEGREINRRTEFEIKGGDLQSSHKEQ